ncbi:hypothetical protein N9Y26_00540 [bacterium]|nr:hypothetical protein [bacterium]
MEPIQLNLVIDVKDKNKLANYRYATSFEELREGVAWHFWTNRYSSEDPLCVPIAHGEGRYFA